MVKLQIVVGEPDTLITETCPDCGFDSMLAFPLTALSELGVTPWGVKWACGRCYPNSDEDT